MAKQDHKSENEELNTDHPISEKDEVKEAEDRTAKQQNENESKKVDDLKKKLSE